MSKTILNQLQSVDPNSQSVKNLYYYIHEMLDILPGIHGELSNLGIDTADYTKVWNLTEELSTAITELWENR